MYNVLTLRTLNRCIIGVGIILILLLTRHNTASWNDASRFATIEKLVSEQTFSINNSIFWTGDKIYVNGLFYSDKPPLFAVFASAPYAVLYQLGIPFSYHPSEIVYITNLFALALPFILFGYALYWFARKDNPSHDKEKILFMVLLLLMGTVLLSYTTQLNNHITAAMFVGFATLIMYYKKIYSARDTFIIALLLSFATTFDPGAGFVAACSAIVVGWNVIRNKEQGVNNKYAKILFYFVGAIIPVLIHYFVNVQITGDIKPGSMHPELFNWEGSEFTLDILTGASFAVSSFMGWLKYLWYTVFFGYKGLLLHSPIVGLGIGVAASVFFRSKITHEKIYALFSLLSILLVIIYYSLFGKLGAGTSYTIRWFLIFIPLLFPLVITWTLQNKKRLQWVMLLCVIPLLWNVAAMGNVMGRAYSIDAYAFANAWIAFPPYFVQQWGNVLELLHL